MKRNKRFKFKRDLVVQMSNGDFDTLLKYLSLAESFSALQLDSEIYNSYKQLISLIDAKICPFDNCDIVSNKQIKVFKIY